uniref:Hpt domain-containing protein n=1 Tax=Candidatus Magnetaquicoccus inordinatus TaxID=2496818 RepID=UPI00187D57E4
MNEQELLRKLREAFRQEAGERLSTIGSALLELEKVGLQGVSAALLEGIYRDAHSLKGAARAVSLREMEAVCQAMEGVFSALKGGSLPLSPGLFDRLHRAIAFLEKVLARDLNQPLPTAARRDLLALLAELEGVVQSVQKGRASQPLATTSTLEAPS